METSGVHLRVGLGRGEHHTSLMENIVATWESWSVMTLTLEGTAVAFSLASTPRELQGNGRRASSASSGKPDKAEGTGRRSPDGVSQTHKRKVAIRDRGRIKAQGCLQRAGHAE